MPALKPIFGWINTVFEKAYRTWKAHRGSTSRYHRAGTLLQFSGHVKICLTCNFISDGLKRCTWKFTRESIQFFWQSQDEIQRRSSKKTDLTVEITRNQHLLGFKKIMANVQELLMVFFLSQYVQKCCKTIDRERSILWVMSRDIRNMRSKE